MSDSSSLIAWYPSPIRRSVESIETEPALQQLYGVIGLVPKISEKYPDLDQEESKVLAGYALAKGKGKELILSAVMEKVAVILQSLRRWPESRQDIRLPVVAKLINYQRFFRENGISPSKLNHFLSSRIVTQPIVAPRGLPPRVEELLRSVAFDGQLTYYDLVRQNSSAIYLLPSLSNEIKIISPGYVGAAEELSRSVLVDISKPLTDWQLADTVVHEDAHIRYFYKWDQAPIDLRVSERYAQVTQVRFLLALRGQNIIEDTLELRGTLAEYIDKIKVLNLELHRPENDLTLPPNGH
jgi:hypothetical protein